MIKSFMGKEPRISGAAYLIGDSFLGGDVEIQEYANIWPNVSARGDVERIVVGKYTNIQDNSVLHCDHHMPLIIGDYVTVGHGAILHGCKIGSRVLVGIGAILLNGVTVEDDVIIGAGSLVTENKVLTSGKLYMGSPAKAVRDLSPHEITALQESALHYVELAKNFAK